MYNADNNDEIYGVNPPAIGTRLLQSPLRFTGNNNDTAKLPYDTLIGYRLVGMTAYNWFTNSHPDPCLDHPTHATEAYYFMKGFDMCGRTFVNPLNNQPTKFMYDGDACGRTGWFDSLSRQYMNLQSSGPFTINSIDTQIVVMSFVITRDGGNNYQNVCAVQSYSDSALKYYYNDFRTCTPIGIQPISNEVPARFELLQNYPNPFNPTTNFEFRIADFGLVRLVIYDILGREVTTLINEKLQPGSYKADWDASNYPSGIYFYTLSTENFTDTKKMVLIK
jgi:hypothetical protein